MSFILCLINKHFFAFYGKIASKGSQRFFVSLREEKKISEVTLDVGFNQLQLVHLYCSDLES